MNNAYRDSYDLSTVKCAYVVEKVKMLKDALFQKHKRVFAVDDSKNVNASAGNRTRAARVAGEHSTTEPPMLMYNTERNQ